MMTTLKRQDASYPKTVGGSRTMITVESYRVLDGRRDVGAVEHKGTGYGAWVGAKFVGEFPTPALAHQEADNAYSRQKQLAEALSRLTTIIEGRHAK